MLTKFLLFGKGSCKINEYLNWSFSALHPSQPRDLFHEMLTKMSSAASPDNQPVGMEMSVWVKEQLCMGFFPGPLPNLWTWFGQSISSLVLVVVVGKMLAARPYKQSELS